MYFECRMLNEMYLFFCLIFISNVVLTLKNQCFFLNFYIVCVFSTFFLISFYHCPKTYNFFCCSFIDRLKFKFFQPVSWMFF